MTGVSFFAANRFVLAALLVLVCGGVNVQSNQATDSMVLNEVDETSCPNSRSREVDASDALIVVSTISSSPNTVVQHYSISITHLLF
jgi:hypothetical protein